MKLELRVVEQPTANLEVLRDGLRAAMAESLAVAEKETTQRAPVGVGGQAGFKGSIFSEVRESPDYFQGITSSPLPYADPLEYGRRAGARMPPVAALIPWVEQFLTLRPGDSAKGVAFAIARYMAQRGSRSWRQSPPGDRTFERAFEASQPQILAIFERMVGAVAPRLLTNGAGR